MALVSYYWTDTRVDRGYTHDTARKLRSQAQTLRLGRDGGHEDEPRDGFEHSFHLVYSRWLDVDVLK